MQNMEQIGWFLAVFFGLLIAFFIWIILDGKDDEERKDDKV
jgi:cytosine/uracil/thiamine/allantoin permease